MARVYKNVDKLKVAIQKKEEALKKAKEESTRKFANLGFGYSMRCSKINISFTKEDNLKEDLKELYSQLQKLLRD